MKALKELKRLANVLEEAREELAAQGTVVYKLTGNPDRPDGYYAYRDQDQKALGPFSTEEDLIFALAEQGALT